MVASVSSLLPPRSSLLAGSPDSVVEPLKPEVEGTGALSPTTGDSLTISEATGAGGEDTGEMESVAGAIKLEVEGTGVLFPARDDSLTTEVTGAEDVGVAGVIKGATGAVTPTTGPESAPLVETAFPVCESKLVSIAEGALLESCTQGELAPKLDAETVPVSKLALLRMVAAVVQLPGAAESSLEVAAPVSDPGVVLQRLPFSATQV